MEQVNQQGFAIPSMLIWYIMHAAVQAEQHNLKAAPSWRAAEQAAYK